VFASAEKSSHSSLQLKAQNATPAFFRKAGEGDFFAKSEQPAFFGNTIQPKLEVSRPDDPQEKEADAMADRVMRMPDTALVQPQKQDEQEQVQRKEEEDETLQTSREINGPVCSNCTEKGTIQTKYAGTLFRQVADNKEGAYYADDGLHADAEVQRKAIGLHRSDVIQLSGRGPPAGLPHMSFEQNLSSSKGGGSALPETTRTFMESRFGADFGGVRIHTGEKAQELSQTIHAHAFTHGNDIYFNQGKYNPDSASGGNLLAHELTHTLQQGASQPKSQAASPSASGVSRKIQRAAAGVPVQLTNAVEKAKTVEGKIDANKPQADGNRTGYEHLLEIFKTTFGEEMIVRNGGSAVKGAVAEDDIKKKRIQDGVMVVDTTTRTDRTSAMGTKTGSRDAMPSWCGIFVFWALNKSGVPMPKWKLGERMIPLEAARAPGAMPMPGDIAYRNAFSHFAIVESVQGSTVRTVNGNTAGEDNLGGQVQTIEHPLSEWSAFFNPLQVMTGSLGDGEQAGNPVPKTIAELRKEQPIQAKTKTGEEEELQTKQAPELSNFVVGPAGSIEAKTDTTAKQPVPIQRQEDPAKEEEEEVSETAQSLHLHRFAHEAQWQPTHTIYQRSAIEPLQHGGKELYGEKPNHTSANLQSIQLKPLPQSDRGPPVLQRQASGNPVIQRSPIDVAFAGVTLGELLDCVYVTDLNRTSICLLRKASAIAMRIPGYKALRVVLGKDPISGVQVERNGHNLLDAAFDIMPGGTYFKAKLKETGKLDAAAQWIDGKIDGLQRLVNNLLVEFDNFWNRLGITDFRAPMEVLRRGAGIVFDFIGHLVRFATDAVKELLDMIKQVLLRKLVEFIKENTNAYPLLTVILGEDPITKEKVAPTGTNILHAILELGGEEGRLQRTQMQETGSFAKAAAFIDEGIAVFGNLYQSIIANFNLIWDAVNIQSLMQLVATFRRIFNGFAQPIRRVLDFVKRVGIEILKLIKEALMQRLSTWARTVRGYTLVTVIIGSDPFTGQIVPFTMDNVIRGFFGLMDGGEAQYDELKQSGAIDRTVAKVTKAVQRLNMTPAAIIQLFVGLWNSFSLRDLMNPMVAFRRIMATFGAPIRRLVVFVIEIVKIVIEAILIVMNFPFDIVNNIIAKAMAAFERIKRDPVAFLKNLLRAIKQGFIQFFDNIFRHLLGGLADWIFFQLKDLGIQKPEDLSIRSILKLVIDVLGISMQRIMDKVWKKLEEKIGKEKVEKIKRVIDKLEGIWKFIKDVMERGPVAIWEFIQEKLSNLWSTIIDAAKNFIMERIIGVVVTKLLSMLDPTGIMAVVNSVIAIYRAIQSFIEYLRQMLEIVNSFVEGVAEIAAGNIRTAANFVERSMVRAIPIVFGFLANQVGLGKIADKLKEIIEAIREKVDNAIDWLVDKAVNMGMAILDRLIAMAKSAKEAILGWFGLKKNFTGGDGKPHEIFFQGQGDSAVLIIKSDPTPYTKFLENYEKQLGTNASEEVDVGGKKKKKSQVIADAKVIAEAIEQEKRKKLATYPGATDKDKEASKATAIEKLLTDLAAASVPLFGAAKDKPKDEEIVIPQGSNNDSFAVTQEAKLIWKTPKVISNGSGPTSAKHAIYDKIDFRQKGDGSYYIRGHLINDNLGGPGNWNNMTALSRTANHEHEQKVESKVKAAYDTGAVVRYKVTASGKQDVKKATSADKNKFKKIGDFATALPYLEKITEAESQVPNTLTCEAYMMKKEGNNWVDDLTKPIVKDTITFNVGDYGEYELGKLGGTVTLDFAKLKGEASVAKGTFIQFKTQDKIHENSISLLTDEEVKELVKVFEDNERERNREDELTTIGKMKAAKDITTWAAFATRIFFNTKDASYNTVETAFKNTQSTLRKNAIDAAGALVEAAAPGAFRNTTWQAFKIAQLINFKTEGTEGNEIEIIENKFRLKQ